ncbi:MAG: phosphate signaling complex protein PhoU [Clostridiales bacterium]|nr:phosphate signaling complex protein PhoU [Clostridiales bacterium]
MRNQFDEQLQALNLQMIQMGGLCETVISLAVQALQKEDKHLIQKVHETDGEIDQMERDIEAFCMRLLLHQQPVAKDLRQISSALKMISDMERIGDQAADIAEIAEYMPGMQTLGDHFIGKMAREAVRMVTDSVDAYVRRDLELARNIIQYDDIVDDWFSRIKQELIGEISRDNAVGEFCLDLLMIAKYLERIGDHAVNIAEWVEFSITGVHRKY